MAVGDFYASDASTLAGVGRHARMLMCDKNQPSNSWIADQSQQQRAEAREHRNVPSMSSLIE